MNRSDKELTKQVALMQEKTNLKGDFVPHVHADLSLLDLHKHDVVGMGTNQVKALLSSKVKTVAFDYLMKKVNDTLYNNCDGSEYFNDPRFSPNLANLLFKFRTRMFMVKNNFRNNYRNSDITCPVCLGADDTQEHLFNCEKVMQIYENDNDQNDGKYEDIFCKDNDKLHVVSKKLKKLVEIRETLLNPENESS